MSRLLAAAILVVLLPGLASAQESCTLRIVEATVADAKMQWTDCRSVPVTKTVAVEVEKNGAKVIETRTVTVFEKVSVVVEAELKTVKATDAAGKAIKADKLAELLKDSTPVVLTTEPLTEKQRALFKDKVIFVELPPGPKQG